MVLSSSLDSASPCCRVDEEWAESIESSSEEDAGVASDVGSVEGSCTNEPYKTKIETYTCLWASYLCIYI